MAKMLTPPELFAKLANRLVYLYRLYVIRNPFQVNVKRWFADRGDETLRLNYPLDKQSIVFDVGGYLGDYAQAIHRKFGCRVYLFEPVPKFYDQCVSRFSGNPSITCFNYGLSSTSGFFSINLNNNESSFKKADDTGVKEVAEVRAFPSVVTELGLENIDLIKMNIEGGEFDLLPSILTSGLIGKVKYIQVQFHDFQADAAVARTRIRSALQKTHREMWNYEFVWESWELL